MVMYAVAYGNAFLNSPGIADRELEVFRMIGNGLTLQQIARKLHVGVKTVETHKRRIKQKLKLENAAQLARNAAQWALKNG